MGASSKKVPKVGLKAELRNARVTKHLLYSTKIHEPVRSACPCWFDIYLQPPALAKSSNSIIWDLSYKKPKGADQHKIEAPPNVIERLLRYD